MRETEHFIRHRLAACIVLVAVMSMLVHMAVPHHHHARFVALVCLHEHHLTAVDDNPQCTAGSVDCQSEDSADCQPCDSAAQAVVRAAQRQLGACDTLPLHLLPSWHFLLSGWLSCPPPMLTGMDADGRHRACRVFLPGSSHGLTFGLRAPPQVC